MPRYRVTIPKEVISGPLTGRRWRNVYMVEADSYDSALAVGDLIASQELLFHSNIVGVKEISAHLTGGTLPPRTVGKILAVNRVGDTAPAGSLLPFWNCVRVDYVNTDTGRPERKYYRPPLYTSQVTGLVLEGTFFTLIQDHVAVIAGYANYVGPSGEQHAAAVVDSLVQMRQTGWHRHKRPGFIRGYVPVAP